MGSANRIRISLRAGVCPEWRKKFGPTSGQGDFRICLDWENPFAFLEGLRSLAGRGAKTRPREVHSLEGRSVSFVSQLRRASQRDLRRADRRTLPRTRSARRRGCRLVLDWHARRIQSISALIQHFSFSAFLLSAFSSGAATPARAISPESSAGSSAPRRRSFGVTSLRDRHRYSVMANAPFGRPFGYSIPDDTKTFGINRILTRGSSA